MRSPRKMDSPRAKDSPRTPKRTVSVSRPKSPEQSLGESGIIPAVESLAGSFRQASLTFDIQETERKHSVSKANVRRKASQAEKIPDSMLGSEAKRVGEINIQLKLLENEEECVFDKGVTAASNELAAAAAHLQEAHASVKSPPTLHLGGTTPRPANTGDVFVRMMQEKMREQQDHARKKLLAAQQNLHQNVSRLKNMQRVHESKEKQLALILARENVTSMKMRKRIEELQVELEKERDTSDMHQCQGQQKERKLLKYLAEAGLQMRQFKFTLMREVQELLGKRETTIESLRSWVGIKQQQHVEAQLQTPEGQRLPPDQDPEVLNLRIDKLERLNERLKTNADELQVLDRLKTAQLRTIEEKLVELTEKCRGMLPAEDLFPLKGKVKSLGGGLDAIKDIVDEFRGKVFGALADELNKGIVSRCTAIDAKIQESEEKAKNALAEAERTRKALHNAQKALTDTATITHQTIAGLEPAAHTSVTEAERRIPWEGEPIPPAIKDLDREMQALTEIVLQVRGQAEKMRQLEKEAAEAKKEAERVKAKFLEMEQQLANQQAETLKARKRVMELEATMKDLTKEWDKKEAAWKEKEAELTQELSQTQTTLTKTQAELEELQEDMAKRIAQAEAEARGLGVLQVVEELGEKMEAITNQGLLHQTTVKITKLLQKFGVDIKTPAKKKKSPPKESEYQKMYTDLIHELNLRGIMKGKNFMPGLVIITAEMQAQMGVLDRMDMKEKHSERAWQAKTAVLKQKSRRELETIYRVVSLEETVAKRLVGKDERLKDQLRMFTMKKELIEELLAGMSPESPHPTEKYEPHWVQYSMKPGSVATSPLAGKPKWPSDATMSDSGDDWMTGTGQSRDLLFNATTGSVDYCRGRLKQTAVKRVGGTQHFSSTLPARIPDISEPLSPLIPVEDAGDTASDISYDRCGRVSLPAVCPGPRLQQTAPPSQVPMAMRRHHADPIADHATRAEEVSRSPRSRRAVATTVDLTLSSDEEDDQSEPDFFASTSGSRARTRTTRSGGLRDCPRAVSAREKQLTQWAGASKLRQHLEDKRRQHTSPRSVSMIDDYLDDVAEMMSPQVCEKLPTTCGGVCPDETQEMSPRANKLPIVPNVDQVRKELQQGPAKFAELAKKKNRQAAMKRLKELVPRSYNTTVQLNRSPLELPPQLGRSVCFTLTATTGSVRKEVSKEST